MISLTVTGHAEPEQDREEIARELEKHGVGAVCLLRDGRTVTLKGATTAGLRVFDFSGVYHEMDGTFFANHDCDIIRVFPPGTRLRVTVQVVE
jgi:hypothetical protein